MYLRAVGHGFTQINAYFLVMNSKRYNNNNNNNNNNKCKDNETNNGEDDDDQTHTQKTKWIYSVAP